MAVIHDTTARLQAKHTNPLLIGFIDWVRKEFADDVWRWFNAHKEDELVTIKKWFISFVVRVKHVRLLVEWIVGPEKRKE